MQPGIHPPFEACYIQAMLWHRSSPQMHSSKPIDSGRKLWLDHHGYSNLSKDDLFCKLQNILHQAGCISRYLFPSRNKPLHTAVRIAGSAIGDEANC